MDTDAKSAPCPILGKCHDSQDLQIAGSAYTTILTIGGYIPLNMRSAFSSHPEDFPKARTERRQSWSRKRFLAGALVLVTLVAGGCILVAQDKVKLPGEDWISLFNGTDLTGWSKVGNESWTVEDGLIHGKGLTKDYGYLQSVKNYKNFQLSLRFKCVGDGNSGVFFHSAFKPGTADVTQGMQFEIDCKMMHHTAGVYAEDGREWVAWPAPENEGVVRMGEWNDYLLEVVGNRYRSRLNGVEMVDFTDPKPSSFDGTIALQLHAGGQGNMEFKDVWIRDLSAR